MPSNWTVPVVADISSVLAQPAIDKAVGIGSTDTAAKLANILALVVERVRNTILNNSRGHQVSVTAGAVPPEAKQFVLVMAARQLVDSIPGMSATIADGENFKTLYEKAENWMKAVQEGASVSDPTDPDPATVAGPDSAQNYVDLSTTP